MNDTQWSTERIARLVALVVLVVACAQVVMPFVGAIAWAGIIAISIWPAFLWLSARLGQRPKLAATLCSAGLLVVIVMPVVVLAASLGQAVPEVTGLVRDLLVTLTPEPPAWLAGAPLVGEVLGDLWRTVAADMQGFARKLLPMAENAGVWALAQGASLALAVIEFLFAILIAGVLLVTAAHFSEFTGRFVVRLGVGGGTALVDLVVATVRSVSIGLVGTAVVQSLLIMVGLAVAGVPGTVLLGFLTFMVALVQMPVPVVWVPVVLWLYFTGPLLPALGLLVWGVAITPVDNVLRPWLIGRGVRLPFVLILIGVLGGLIAWGFIGLFIGPTLMAVAHSLVRAWLDATVNP